MPGLKTSDLLGFIEDISPGLTPAAAMGRVLSRCRDICRCEAGAVFVLIRNGKHRFLSPLCLQNDRIRISKSDFRIPLPSRTIAGYVAESGDTVNIENVRQIGAGAPYDFDGSFERPGFGTVSMLAFPLIDHQGRVAGVVEVINHLVRGKVVPFTKRHEDLAAIFAKIGGQVLERVLAAERTREANRRLKKSREQAKALAGMAEGAMLTAVSLLSRAAEIHDEGTGNHIVRVNEYSFALARLARAPDRFCDEIRKFAQLHDVGKMSVDMAVLKKPGPLSPGEMEHMRRHTLYGHKILRDTPRFAMGAEIARWHHEHWDGSGYPDGLRGEDIPLSARITALADVYDALRSERSYKSGFSHDKSVRIITGGDDRLNPSSQFDPGLLALFSANHELFKDIWDRLRDDRSP